MDWKFQISTKGDITQNDTDIRWVKVFAWSENTDDTKAHTDIEISVPLKLDCTDSIKELDQLSRIKAKEILLSLIKNL